MQAESLDQIVGLVDEMTDPGYLESDKECLACQDGDWSG